MRHICKTCGHRGRPIIIADGSLLVEIFVWVLSVFTVFFLIVALWYSLWRFSSRKKVCEKCLSQEIIPENSPLGQKLVRGD